MRGYLNVADNVKLVEEYKNPQLLVNRDLDAFAVVRTYERALTEWNVALMNSLAEANQDLLPYFKFVERAYLRDLLLKLA